jgi:hypothetical protein
VRCHCYKLSPFQAHWWRLHCTTFSGLRVYLQFTWEVGLPSSHKLSRSWLLGAHPHSRRSLSGPPGLFIYSSRKDSLPPIFSAQGAPPSFPHVFIVLIAYYSVSFFSPGGGPRVVCGSTMVPLSSSCPRLPKQSVCGWLAAWEPSWFLRLMWSGDVLHRLEVWRGQSFASSRWFCLQGVSPVSLQDFTIAGTLSASSL